MKKLFVWALHVLAAPFVCLAQGSPVVEYDDREIDSLLSALSPVLLQEVTVEARPVISKADGATYLPGESQKRASVSGLELLRKMHIPRLSVNEMQGSISLAGGGSVMLCVNGVAVTPSEVAAISPDDVIRIEYHDPPGARYAASGAAAVVDFITRRHDSGGRISAEGMNALGNGKWAAIDNFSARFNRGCSSVGLAASWFAMHRNNWVRDYEETWRLPTGDVKRIEVGSPVEAGVSALMAHLDYSFAKEGRFVFCGRVGLSAGRVPAKEEGDRHTVLYSSDSELPVEIFEHTTERETSPEVSLYFKRQLHGNSSLTANVAAAYTVSNNAHAYRETMDDVPLCDVASRVNGKKMSMLAEAVYERRWNILNLSAGGGYSGSVTRNDYSGSETAAARFRQSTATAYLTADCHAGPFTVRGEATATLAALRQGEEGFSKFSLLPTAIVSYDPSGRFRISYDLKLRRQLPSLSALSNLEQTVQPGLVIRGNPALKSFLCVENRISLSAGWRWVDVDLLVSLRDEHNPVMPLTFHDGERFVRTYANQRLFRELRGEVALRFKPWSDHLEIALSPSASRFFSYGNDYVHIRNIVRLGVSVDLLLGNWTFTATTLTGDANRMYGEEIITEKDMNMALVGYRGKNWSLQGGVFNAFMKDYWMKTENMSAMTPYVSKAHCGRNAYAVVRFSMTLDFGRQGAAAEVNGVGGGLDADTGIVNGLK